MLSIDICRKCPKSLIHYVDVAIPGDETNLICMKPDNDIDHLTLVSDPPSHCPFKFEHAVAAGVMNKD